ncbi:translation initiation factor eIF 4e-like domain-containing protein [Desarmillaria tabescens]|uniref:Translation initiation factor eIF 4e-like domain-containing protein n=1 Tax=Armillaria tabescens TaxID=1929756 RepID=A0AA39N8E7_ARMTA|nr:translation initiation factor eIF 4e-like domain-containing protein [Desarmillaria tabescens]KAK0460940.1 translation initiation factor eIF 4e-like domain-containing protein [Desarmillaria tabescens]
MTSTELRQEDSMPSKNPYAWSKTSEPEISLDHFLTKYRPSMVRDDGTKPWLWVRAREPSEDSTMEGETAAIAEATVVLEEATEKVQSIQNDASIPVRSNKKTGAKSKKEVREQASLSPVQAGAAEKLKDIAIKNGYTCGKWLVFASSEKVDSIWSGVARSLVDGPLSTTTAFCAKVATCPADEKPNHQHVLCIYMPNVYDKDAVTEVMKILLRHHGLNLSGVKTDLYTDLNIDSKHPSGIPSTIWKATSLMKDTEIKGGELRDAFFNELAARPKDSAPPPASKEPEKSSETAQPDDEKPKPKPKTKLKKKMQVEDAFASDNDEEDAREEEKRKVELKKKLAKARKRDDSDDEEEKPKKKTAKI